jgi:DedD protein
LARTAVSQEEVQLRKRARRRLVGAIALVLVAVVILPMVLDGEPRQRPETIDIDIPPIPADGAGQEAPPRAAALPPGGAAPQAEPAQTTPSAPEPQPPVPSPQAAPAAPAPAAVEARTDAAADGLVIQIGCFADAGKSRSLATRIKANKIPAFSEPAPGRERPCTRVRAGPFASQDAAQNARERLIRLELIPPSSEGKIVRRGD